MPINFNESSVLRLRLSALETTLRSIRVDADKDVHVASQMPMLEGSATQARAAAGMVGTGREVLEEALVHPIEAAVEGAMAVANRESGSTYYRVSSQEHFTRLADLAGGLRTELENMETAPRERIAPGS